MGSFVAGKALVTFEREDIDRFIVRAHIQHLTHSSQDRDAAMDWAREELELMEWPSVRPAPNCTKRMRVGDKMRVAITFYAEAYTGWDFEGDSDMDIVKARCLRHQHARA